jgi:hypothetical protein
MKYLTNPKIDNTPPDQVFVEIISYAETVGQLVIP